jgi:hypothetical protein
VRSEAVAHLTDSAALAKILRTDPSFKVQTTALIRLADEKFVEEVARKNPNWIVRKLAVDKLRDTSAILQSASEDEDFDVRRQALLKLKSQNLLAEVALASPRNDARSEALSFITDNAILKKMAAEDPVSSIREKAARMLADPNAWRGPGSLENKTDARRETVNMILSDPVMVNHYGELSLEFKSTQDERRYTKNPEAAIYPPPRGKVITERVRVSVSDSAGKSLSDRLFRGRKGGKGEAFNETSTEQGGYFVKMNPAEIDYLEICEDLLRPLASEELGQVSLSKNKYLRSMAEALLCP